MVERSVAYRAGQAVGESTLVAVKTGYVVYKWGPKVAVPYIAYRTASYIAPITKRIVPNKVAIFHDTMDAIIEAY